MSVIVILILASLAMALTFLAAFIWSVRSGQYEDTTTPSMRILLEETATRPINHPPGNEPAPTPVVHHPEAREENQRI